MAGQYEDEIVIYKPAGEVIQVQAVRKMNSSGGVLLATPQIVPLNPIDGMRLLIEAASQMSRQLDGIAEMNA